MRFTLPPGDYDLPPFTRGTNFWNARLRNGRIEYNHGGLPARGWNYQGDPNTWTSQDMIDWLADALAGLNTDPVDKPEEIARLKGVLQTIVDMPPDLEAIRKLVAEIK